MESQYNYYFEGGAWLTWFVLFVAAALLLLLKFGKLRSKYLLAGTVLFLGAVALDYTISAITVALQEGVGSSLFSVIIALAMSIGARSAWTTLKLVRGGDVDGS